MRDTYRFNLILFGTFFLVILFLITSCEQEEAIVEMSAAPGGGTVSTYKAYTVQAVAATDVYGRVVFYKDNSGYTLVQTSLYNTADEVEYSTAFFKGTMETQSTETLMSLYNVNGSTGEFAPSKFYVIKDKSFYDGLSDFDAHFEVMEGDILVSAGNIGKNATPVVEAD